MQFKFGEKSERGTLKMALVGTGNTLIRPDQIGEVERLFEDDYGAKEVKYHPESGDWDVELWRSQLKYLHTILRNHGVDLIFPDDISWAWLQVFTRDVGVVLGDTLYTPQMRNNIRRVEKRGTEFLKKYLRPSSFVELETPHLEGGDVFVHKDLVFVGISRQTSWAGFEEFKSHAEKRGYECIPVECEEEVLHLDCRFNVVSHDRAVIIPKGIKPAGINALDKYFHLIELPEEGLKTLSTNYIFLSWKKVIVDERNEDVASILSRFAYKVMTVPFTEPTKAWGGPRCSVCPLLRE